MGQHSQSFAVGVLFLDQSRSYKKGRRCGRLPHILPVNKVSFKAETVHPNHNMITCV